MIFSNEEEMANTLSHSVGILLGLLLLPALPTGFTYLIYSTCFLFLFISSTAYHAVRNLNLKRQLQKVDHIAIYFMIAGSYTPFIFACLKENAAWLFFYIMWSIVLVGTIFKVFFTGRFERLSLVLYLGMGWMLIFIIKPFLDTFDINTISLVVLGGFFYTSGVYFYANDDKRFYHLVWHLFVLGGALSHLAAIWNIMK